MLQNLRDNSKGLISGILIGLLVIIFAISGAESLFTSSDSSSDALSVNGESVSETEVVRAIEMRKQQILSRYGASVPADFLTAEKLREPAIDSLIQRSLMVQAAKKGGLAANDDSLSQEITGTTAFHSSSGEFDQATYIRLLGNQGFTPTTYKKALADDLIVNQLQAGLVGSAFVTPTELKTIVELSFQTRTFDYVTIPADKIQKDVVVEDKDIKEHYEKNPQNYMLPERVAVDYIELSTDALMENIKVSDEQVQKQYEQNTRAFVAKTERHAAHILLEGDSEKLSEEVKAKLDAGEDFAKLAQEYSTDSGSKEQGGDLGFSSGEAFPAEFESALAKLKVGEVSAPVKTSSGVHFIKLIEERGAKPATFAEAKASIIEQLKLTEANDQFAVKFKQLSDDSFNAESLVDLAQELGLQSHNTSLFAKTGGKDLTANPLFVNAAFSSGVINEGNSSTVIELKPNHVVVLKKTDHKPSELEPLESVRTKITEVVRAEKTQAILTQQAQEFLAAVTAGKPLSEQAKTAGLAVKSASAVSRSDKEVDRDVLQYAFKLSRPANGSVFGSTQTNNGDLAVVALDSVTLGTDDKVPAEQKASIVTQLANINGEYDLKSFQSHLQEVAEIKHR